MIFSLSILASLVVGASADLSSIFSSIARVHVPDVFINLDIGLIVACAPESSTSVCVPVHSPHHWPQYLIDTPCSDNECVLNLLEDFLEASDKAVLIAWDECRINEWSIESDIDSSDDDHRFYVTTIIQNGELLSQISEECNAIPSASARNYNHQPSIFNSIKQRNLEKITVHKLKANGWNLDH